MRKYAQERTLKVASTPGYVEVAEAVSSALRAVTIALGGLEFEEKRKVLRYAAELHGIDPGKLEGMALRS